MSDTPVVITGVGPVSVAGIGRQAFAAGIAGDSSLSASLSLFSAEGLTCSQAAEVTGLDLGQLLESEKTYLDRCSEFALGATALALRDAGLIVDDTNSHRIGLCLGSMYGCLDTMRTFLDRLLTKGAKYANSLLFSHSYVNSPISLVSIEFGVRGYHSTYTNGLTSGAAAVAHARDVIQSGQADAVLAGGTDALSETLFRALCDADLLAREGSGQGWLPGEGAGLVVLETEEHALDRGATVVGRLVGAGLANDLHMTGDGLRRSLQAAMGEAGRLPADIGAVYLTANGNPATDGAECSALAQVFGEAAPEQHRIKERLGEPMAAGGPLSLIAAVASLDRGGSALINSMDTNGGCVSLLVDRAEVTA